MRCLREPLADIANDFQSDAGFFHEHSQEIPARQNTQERLSKRLGKHGVARLFAKDEIPKDIPRPKNRDNIFAPVYRLPVKLHMPLADEVNIFCGLFRGKHDLFRLEIFFHNGEADLSGFVAAQAFKER